MLNVPLFRYVSMIFLMNVIFTITLTLAFSSSDDTSLTRRFFPLTEIDANSRYFNFSRYFVFLGLYNQKYAQVTNVVDREVLLHFFIQIPSFSGKLWWTSWMKSRSEGGEWCSVIFKSVSRNCQNNLIFIEWVFEVVVLRTCIGLGLKVALEDSQLLNNNQVL